MKLHTTTTMRIVQFSVTVHIKFTDRCRSSVNFGGQLDKPFLPENICMKN